MTEFFNGFDTSIIPANKLWGSLAKDFRFCGYYLVAPSHQNASWRGQRSYVLGFRVNPVAIFVGEELAGPGSHLVNAAEGDADGRLAVARMQAEGFPAKSTVYLDLEIPSLPANMIAYIQRWCRQVALGGYLAGVYCSHAIAAAVAQLTLGARIWAARVPTVSETTAVPPFIANDPAGCGYEHATVWQYRVEVVLPTIGNQLVDLNTSTMADPGAPPLPLAA